MNGLTLFKLCQQLQGRRYNKGLEYYAEQSYANYFEEVSYKLTKLLRDSDKNVKNYLRICHINFGDSFDPYKLLSEEYQDAFRVWLSQNRSKSDYIRKINDSFDYIYNFCIKNKIETLNEYTRIWGVNHLLSGKITENVAFAIGIHKNNLSKPEKMALEKKFLKNLKVIEERLIREKRIGRLIEEEKQKLEILLKKPVDMEKSPDKINPSNT